jgi:hypothetical protein
MTKMTNKTRASNISNISNAITAAQILNEAGKWAIVGELNNMANIYRYDILQESIKIQ